ncbi:MAG: twin-arginine translocase TatA/TatE family subunit [Actinobacteria bacterium]|nr:twin-arginine translocase TatA/TatE family subunit [Actinomycetota bacterium]
MPSGGLFGILDSLTTGEVMIILVVALVVLGPDRLPEMARTIGAWVAKARRIAANLEGEMREVLDDPAMKPIREVGEFVAQPRRKLTEYVTAAERDAERAARAEAEAAAPAIEASAGDPGDDGRPEPEAEPAAEPEPEPAAEAAAEPEPQPQREAGLAAPSRATGALVAPTTAEPVVRAESTESVEPS